MSSPSSPSPDTDPPTARSGRQRTALVERLRVGAIRFVLRPILKLALGIHVAGAERLPVTGPAIIAPNHNSHLDILAVIAAVPGRSLSRLRPVGAADTFLTGSAALRLVARWLNVIPLDRTPRRESAASAMAALSDALSENDILVLFPEGTRGDPETPSPIKAGLSRLAITESAPVYPLYIQGAGRSLPRGSRVFVPFTCTIVCGGAIEPSGLDRTTLMTRYENAMEALKADAPPLRWT